MSESYIETLKGVVALPCYMDRSLADFARATKLCLEEEQRKPSPDNHLIAVLCDAARVGWELIEANKVKDIDPAIEAKHQLAEAQAEIERLREAMDTIVVEFCALLLEPKNPDWMPALGNNNEADAESLQKTLDVARTFSPKYGHALNGEEAK